MQAEVATQDVTRFFAAIEKLQKSLHEAWSEHDGRPAAGSRAEAETRNLDRGNQAKSAHGYGYLTLLVADDHLTALTRLAVNPVSALAPATCARAVLESAALCSWLCDPSVSIEARVARMYAYRYEGLTQQAKLNAINEPSIEQQIDAMEREALGLGYARLEKGGTRAGVGVKMPPTTGLIRTALELPSEYQFASVYKFLSGIVHGHYYAVSQFGFKEVDNPDPTSNDRLISKHAHPVSLALCGVNSVLAYSVALCSLSRLFGWGEILPLVASAYEEMELNKIFEADHL